MKHCTGLNCLRAIAGLLSLVLSDACWALEAVDIAAIRQQFVQDHEPADAMTLAAVREILTKNPGNAPHTDNAFLGNIVYLSTQLISVGVRDIVGIHVKQVNAFGACPLDTAVEQPVSGFLPRPSNDDLCWNQDGQPTAAREMMGSRT